MKRFAAALAALLAASMAGAAPIHGTLTAHSIGADDASTTGTVGLLLLLHATGNDPMAEPRFRLHSPTLLSIEADHTDVYSRGVVVGPPIEPTPVHDGPGWLNGTTNRQSHRLWLTSINGLPAPTVELHGPATLTPPPTEEVVLEPKVKNDRGDQSVNLARQAAWTSPSHTKAVIRGDFRIALWEWDTMLDAPGRYELLPSGVQGPAADARTGSASEIYVTAHNATLTIPLAVNTYHLHLNVARLHASGVLHLRQAEGTLTGLSAPLDGDLKLRGTLDVDVAANSADQPLTANVQGDVKQASLNNDPLSLSSPPPPGSDGGSGFATVALLALASAAALWFARRRGGAKAPTEPAAPPPAATKAGLATRATTVPRGGRDRKAEQQVLSVVAASPGMMMTELLATVDVSKERTYHARDALVADGALVWREDAGKRHLFVAAPNLDRAWRPLARLRDAHYRLLWGWLDRHPGAEWRDILDTAASWGWSESKTKNRLRGLVDVGLAAREGPSRRGTYSALAPPAF